MKYLIKIFYILIFFLSACSDSDPYHADKHLSEMQKNQILLTTVRYMGHLPKKGNHETKFDQAFDKHYSNLAKDYTLEAYFKNDDFEYFLASRIAPSLKEKKIAVGVKMQRNTDGNLTYYEEVFRTWKFDVPEMQEKGLMLFEKMVNKKDLTPYYPQNSDKEEFIEFPDQRVYFDLDEKRWLLRGGES